MGRMHANVYSLLEGVDLMAVCDKRPEKRHEFSETFGVAGFEHLEEMLDGVDIVDVCLPTYLHREATVTAANAGKHVVCEKPIALTPEDADAMINAVDSAGVQLMIGHCIRFWPEYALLKEIVDDNRLGKLLSINLTRYGEFPYWSSENWLADESKAGGGVLDMHIHDTDYILYLLGEPQSLSSWGSVDGRGPGHVFTTMQYPGCVAHLEGGWNLPSNTPFKMTFRAIFEQGAAIMEGGPLTIYRPGKDPEVPVFAQMKAEGGGNISDLGGYYHELAYFVRRLQEGKPMEIVTPQSSKLSLQTTLEEIRQIKSR